MKYYMWHNRMCISYLLRLKQMEQFFIANDWQSTDDPSKADYAIIGACAAFLPYFNTYAEKVRTLAPFENKLVVYGCLPIVNREFYRENTPNTALFVPTRYPERIEPVVKELKVRWADIPIPGEFRRCDYTDYDPNKRYILIEEGCTEGCVYCPHKLGTGREKSRPLEEIVSQIRKEVDEGATIMVLEGNNGGAWGLDLNPVQTYANLLEAVLKIAEGIEIHIGDFAAKWVRHYGDALKHPRITDIKIPIQSVSERLLEQMGRDPYVREMGPLLKELKKGNNRLYFRTEIIIGFPSSTEEELIDTLNFVSEYFDKVSCFSYDFHPHTKIARMGIPFLDDTVVEDRIKLAMEFFQDKPHIVAAFDDRGRICANIMSMIETDAEEVN